MKIRGTLSADAIDFDPSSESGALAVNVTGNATTATTANSVASGAVFQSSEQTATGSPQNIAHGFGSTPKLAWAVCTNSGATGSYTLIPATHDATNVSFNGTSGIKYRAYAIK